MDLLYISQYQFEQKGNRTFSLPAYGNQFWQKYLNVFEHVTILGEKIKDYLNNGTTVEITEEKVFVEIIPSIIHPKDWINDHKVYKILESKISNATAILVKPSSRKGIMAIKLCKKYNKPYMIELTGDLLLTLKQNSDILKKLYAPILHRQILRAIADCKFGLYVTNEYLQSVYPIIGEQCGVTDACIDYCDDTVLARRIKKINDLKSDSQIQIGIIGSYHDNRKGLDTAIKALNEIKDKKLQINVLALGTEEDRIKWNDFAHKNMFIHSLVFSNPCSTREDVFSWIDSQDINILPSRSEGLPRCIVEAMSRACPCIVSNVCGLPELISREWLHDPEDYYSLSILIYKMINSKDLLKHEAINNFQKSKKYLKVDLDKKRFDFLTRFKDYCSKVLSI